MGGGLIQLVAYGAPDVYLTTNGGESLPSNTRDSIMYWFVGRQNGLAREGDVAAEHPGKEQVQEDDDKDASGLFSHALQHQRPSRDVTQPIYVRSGAPLQAEAALAALMAHTANAKFNGTPHVDHFTACLATGRPSERQISMCHSGGLCQNMWQAIVSFQ
jgi:hypothetical protein